MSIAAALEANARERWERNLEQERLLLPELIKEPINTQSGQLEAGIVQDAWQNEGTRYTSTIRSLAPYSKFVDDGTGVYGPNGARIYSNTPGKPLVFYWPKAGKTVAFMSVAGMPPQHFFHDRIPDLYARALAAAWA